MNSNWLEAPLYTLGASRDTAPNRDLPSLEIDVSNRQRIKNCGAQSGVQQHQDDGLIPNRTRPAYPAL
jgi:hypothetical protein